MGCTCSSARPNEKASLVGSNSKSYNEAKAVFEQKSQPKNKTNVPSPQTTKTQTQVKQQTKPQVNNTAKYTQTTQINNNKPTQPTKTTNTVNNKVTKTEVKQTQPQNKYTTSNKPSFPPTTQSNAPNFKVPQSKTGALLQWCQENTKEYKDIEIKNFTTSWKDGRAFIALLHHFRPDLISMNQITNSNVKNLDLAFKQAAKAGIAQLLEADEIAECQEKLSIITYLTLWYKQFGSK